MSKIKEILIGNATVSTTNSVQVTVSDSKKEMVSHPDHYNKGDKTYEPYKVIAEWKLNFNIGSSAKYLARYEDKWNPIEDLEKAKQYIDFEIEYLTENFIDIVSCHTADDKYYVCKVINAWNLNFNIGTAVKCLNEYRSHNFPINVLKQAKEYIDYEIERLKEKNGCK